MITTLLINKWNVLYYQKGKITLNFVKELKKFSSYYKNDFITSNPYKMYPYMYNVNILHKKPRLTNKSITTISFDHKFQGQTEFPK